MNIPPGHLVFDVIKVNHSRWLPLGACAKCCNNIAFKRWASLFLQAPTNSSFGQETNELEAKSFDRKAAVGAGQSNSPESSIPLSLTG